MPCLCRLLVDLFGHTRPYALQRIHETLTIIVKSRICTAQVRGCNNIFHEP